MEEMEFTPEEVLDNNDMELSFEDEEVSTTEEVTEVTETVEKEIDYTPFLQTISDKAKFNHEPVKVETLDEVISNFQKGLNYDKLQEKLNELSNSEELTYLKEKAEENGITTKEFIKLVKEQEETSKKEAYQRQYDSLIEEGVSEELVKDMLAKLSKVDELERKAKVLEQKEQLEKQKSAKDMEYEDFLKAYPDVKPEELPKEVITADNIKVAYIEHQNKQLMKELENLKQNQDNANRNPVTKVSEHGGVVTESKDPFLMGFED